MSSKKRYDINQPKYLEESSEEVDEELEEVDDELEDDTDQSEVPDGFQNTFNDSDDGGVTEQDSGDESEKSYVKSESSDDEEPPRRRAKRKQQLERAEAEPEVFVAKSGRRWTTQEPPKRKLPLANIVRQRSGIGRQATSIQTVKEAFQLVMTPNMINLIVTETNGYGHLVMKQWNDLNPDKEKRWKETDADEILAFIGLLVLAGVHRAKNEALNDLWSMTNGRPIFRATMFKIRFRSLLQFCRFDNKNTRDQRLKDDKLAAIRDLWMMFLAQLKTCFIPGESLTIDEQLVSTRGRCSFWQYIPSKPEKYGLKIFWCCDSMTAYPLNAEVYLGRQSQTVAASNNMTRITNLVKRLVEPWINTGRTITTDNYFTSVELAEYLLGVRTTLVGTIRSNKKEIPKQLHPDRKRPEQSSIFCFDRQLTLVSYVPKKGKSVILLSSMHHDKNINESQKQKPDIILYYNETKGGVDRLDQMVQTYSSKRKTKRWPMTFFFNMIDVGGVAAFLVWNKKNPQWEEGKTHKRRLFLLQLGFELVEAHLRRRQQEPQSMQKNVRSAMQAIGSPISISISHGVPENVTRRRCQLCPRERDRKVSTHCKSCNIPCCPDHHKVICDMCCEVFMK